MATLPPPEEIETELLEEVGTPDQNTNSSSVTEGLAPTSEPSPEQAEAPIVIIPSASDIQRDNAEVDLGLVQRGEHSAYDDVQLLNAMTGRVPTSFKLHTVRDAWDTMIRQDLAKTRIEAVQLRTLSTQAPVGTRGWRLLRNEAERLEHHNALTEMWLTSRTNLAGPEMRRKPREQVEKGDE